MNYYCDRCKAKTDKIYEIGIRLYHQMRDTQFYEEADICENCKKLVDDFLKPLPQQTTDVCGHTKDDPLGKVACCKEKGHDGEHLSCSGWKWL